MAHSVIKKSYLCTVLFVLFTNIAYVNATGNRTPYDLIFTVRAPDRLQTPKSIDDLRHLICTAAHEGEKISLVGAGKSQGGQTISQSPFSYRISLQQLNNLVGLDLVKKQVTVQAGMTWHQLQAILAPHRLAIKAMQSYGDFSIGGSLSVNVHGQDFRWAPLIQTVESFNLMIWDGQVITVSRTQNQELFGLALGGYGLFGIITQVTLNLTDDVLMQRKIVSINTCDLASYISTHIKNNPAIEFFSARFSLDSSVDLFKKALVVTYEKTNINKPKLFAFNPESFGSKLQNKVLDKLFAAMGTLPMIKSWRFYLEEMYFKRPKIISRNNFMSFSIKGLPQDTQKHHYILQEYFIPYNHLNQFIVNLARIINRHDINILNMTARHIQKDSESMLSFASQEACALVLYIRISNNYASYQTVIDWTEEIINIALAHAGTFYLPYHTIATQKQIESAYPMFKEFIARKKQYDPHEIFSNRLYECYAH